MVKQGDVNENYRQQSASNRINKTQLLKYQYKRVNLQVVEKQQEYLELGKKTNYCAYSPGVRLHSKEFFERGVA